MQDEANAIIEQIVGAATTYGLDVLGAIVILLVGRLVAGWAAKLVSQSIGRSNLDNTLQSFFASLTRYAILTFTVIAVLSQFGVQTASLVAVLGALGLAVGFALQGTLSNVAAGLMLLVFRPFKVGDFIEGGGVAGVVDGLSIFVTELHTPDNVYVVVPNGSLWNTAIRNYGRMPTRRVDITIGIAYEDDIGKAIGCANSLVSADSRILADPAPQIVVGELGDSSVNLYVRVWCVNNAYWDVRFDLQKSLKEAYDAAGITIPYPQRTLHIESGSLAEGGSPAKS